MVSAMAHNKACGLDRIRAPEASQQNGLVHIWFIRVPSQWPWMYHRSCMIQWQASKRSRFKLMPNWRCLQRTKDGMFPRWRIYSGCAGGHGERSLTFLRQMYVARSCRYSNELSTIMRRSSMLLRCGLHKFVLVQTSNIADCDLKMIYPSITLP